MEDGVDDNFLRSDFVDQFKRKSPDQCTAKWVNGHRENLRMTADQFDPRVYGASELLLTQARALEFIPVVGFMEFKLSFRLENEARHAVNACVP